MEKPFRIGILRETKVPPDKRVALTPQQISSLRQFYQDVEFYAQPGDTRCYSDQEYEKAGVNVTEDLSSCDILLGIKEVDKETLIPGKTYMFFAHVGKKQSYNREMLREILEKKIRLIDYEYLRTESGERVAAFGRFAGIVGAYNGLRAWGLLKGTYKLTPAHQRFDLEEMWSGLPPVDQISGLKVLVTGTGLVANGAMETLTKSNFVTVSPDDFLEHEFKVPAVCRIGPEHYVSHVEARPFDLEEFIKSPGEYRSSFLPFTRVADLLITGHYWDPRSPAFFTDEDIARPEFRISVIADISCDLNGPVPSTIRSTTIEDPFYDYNPVTGTEEPPFSRPGNITVMAIDNLPGELPGDASASFGKQLVNNVLNDLITGKDSPMIQRATIAAEGRLTPWFSYLDDFLKDFNT